MSNVDTILKMFGLKASSITRTPESFSSEVYHITLSGGERVIIKIPYNKTKLARERLVLTRLQGLLPVPTVLDVYEGNEEITGALLLSLIPGEPIIGDVNRDLSYQMGQILARLHEVPAPGFGYDTAAGFKYVEGNRWSSFIEGTFESWRRDCKQILDCELYERSCRYFERAMNDMGEPDMASMIHMDFRPGNLLADGNTITGLIDFESSRGGAPEIDFVKIKSYVWDRYPGTESAFLEGYRSIRDTPDLSRSLSFYLLFNAFGGVSWSVRRGLESNQAFLKENIDTLKAIVQ